MELAAERFGAVVERLEQPLGGLPRGRDNVGRIAVAHPVVGELVLVEQFDEIVFASAAYVQVQIREQDTVIDPLSRRRDVAVDLGPPRRAS